MSKVPPTASDHPDTWRFGYPVYHAESREAWRAWLEEHHATERGVWLATWRTGTGRPRLPYPEVVEEALCFGWIDSTVNILDDERALQLVTPRRPRSGWARTNRDRMARLEAQGRMTDAGRRAVEVAQHNGWWTIYDSVDALREPADLAAVLDRTPAARRHWDAFPPSARKQMLWWVVSASRPETRARRISTIVANAEQGRRVSG